MRMTPRPFVAASCVLAALHAIGSASGCSSDSSDSGGGAGAAGAPAQPVAQADFASKLAEAICSNVTECCGDHGYAYDSARCSTNMKTVGQESIDSGSALSGVTYDATAAGNCIWQWQAIATSCVADKDVQAALAKACNGIWVGTKPEGQPCTDGRECAGFADGSVGCVAAAPAGDAGVAQKVCTKTAPAPHGAKGDPCGGTCEPAASGGDRCTDSEGAPAGAKRCWVADGLFCDANKYQCTELVAQGQPCTAMAICADAAYCHAGTCAARIAVGSPCEAAGLADPCQSGAWCNATSKTCEALKADGESCTSYLECASSRCYGGKCIAMSVAASESVCGSK
ncbi:MAG: hypothetical protein HY898_16680 [Deltaproteobacteria bacterium]|nr:hypothetical protein [Deltaproteobacteria bacterium]